jgi:hypothetical protein
VRALYTHLLGREASADEVAGQLASQPSLADLLAVITGSEEFAQRHREGRTGTSLGPHFVNTHHPDHARWEHQPGTWSGDGVAVVGHDGWVFIGGGSNANLAQFTGEATLPDSWLDGWRELVAERAADAASLGVELVYLVVPDKIAIHEEQFPTELERRGPRPVERLLGEAGLPILYPLDALRDSRASADVCLRTDSHMTVAGNHLLHGEVLRALGAGHAAIERPAIGLETLGSGDLGTRFEPAIVEVFRVPGDMGSAELAEDNWPEVRAAGGHVGTRRVYRNATAPDPRTLVVFGDSYGFGDPVNPGLSWFLAQSFASVHFVWVPCGWDPGYVRAAGGELVVSQTAERFVGRVPLVRVDAAELAERGRRDDEAISPDVIFGDAPGDAG